MSALLNLFRKEKGKKKESIEESSKDEVVSGSSGHSPSTNTREASVTLPSVTSPSSGNHKDLPFTYPADPQLPLDPPLLPYPSSPKRAGARVVTIHTPTSIDIPSARRRRSVNGGVSRDNFFYSVQQAENELETNDSKEEDGAVHTTDPIPSSAGPTVTEATPQRSASPTVTTTPSPKETENQESVFSPAAVSNQSSTTDVDPGSSVGSYSFQSLIGSEDSLRSDVHEGAEGGPADITLLAKRAAETEEGAVEATQATAKAPPPPGRVANATPILSEMSHKSESGSVTNSLMEHFIDFNVVDLMKEIEEEAAERKKEEPPKAAEEGAIKQQNEIESRERRVPTPDPPPPGSAKDNEATHKEEIKGKKESKEEEVKNDKEKKDKLVGEDDFEKEAKEEQGKTPSTSPAEPTTASPAVPSPSTSRWAVPRKPVSNVPKGKTAPSSPSARSVDGTSAALAPKPPTSPKVGQSPSSGNRRNTIPSNTTTSSSSPPPPVSPRRRSDPLPLSQKGPSSLKDANEKDSTCNLTATPPPDPSSRSSPLLPPVSREASTAAAVRAPPSEPLPTAALTNSKDSVLTVDTPALPPLPAALLSTPSSPSLPQGILQTSPSHGLKSSSPSVALNLRDRIHVNGNGEKSKPPRKGMLQFEPIESMGSEEETKDGEGEGEGISMHSHISDYGRYQVETGETVVMRGGSRSRHTPKKGEVGQGDGKEEEVEDIADPSTTSIVKLRQQFFNNLK